MLQGLLNIPRFRRDPIEFLRSRQRSEGDVFRFQLGPMSIHFFAHPDAVEQVYSQPKSLVRAAMMRKIVPVTGESILVASGDLWKRKRLTANPVFLPKNIAALSATMGQLIEKHVAKWHDLADKGPTDMRHNSVVLTMEVVTTALFGRPVDRMPKGFEKHVDNMFATVARRLENPLAPPLWVPTPNYRRFHEGVAAINQVIFEIIDDRLKDPEKGNDLLSLLLRSMQAEGAVDRTALRDEVVTYFLAGFETTATTLTWCFYELARNPEYIDKIASDPAFATAVIQETLRLRPPAWMFDSEALEDLTIAGRKIRKGDHVWVSQYVTHRHPEFWDDAETFRPERFLPENSKDRHKYAFFPFGASARHCIGQGFALQELQMALVAACKNFRWTFSDSTPVGSPAGFVLRPNGPVRCRLLSRGL